MIDKETIKMTTCIFIVLSTFSLIFYLMFFSIQKDDQLFCEYYNYIETENKHDILKKDISAYLLKLLPEKIIDYLHKNDWKFILTEKEIKQIIEEKDCKIADFVNKEKTIGIAIFQDKEIYVNISFENILNATIHEIAHAYDYEISKEIGIRLSETDKFKNIYEQEKSFVKTYYQNNSKEYFAETFQMYFLNNSKLFKNAPQTYNYIKNIIEKASFHKDAFFYAFTSDFASAIN